MVNPLRQFFLTQIEVLELKSAKIGDEQYGVKKSLIYQCFAAADWLLTPARYLFHGNTVRIELKPELLVDHVPSFYPGLRTNESHASSTMQAGELRSSTKSYWRTVIAILLLIPGCLCALFFKLPVWCCAEIRRYRALTCAHFEPMRIEVGKETPITMSSQLSPALEQEIVKRRGLYRTVESIIIHTENLNIDPPNQEELGILGITMGWALHELNPKKVIFVNTTLSKEAIPRLFSERKWQGNDAVKTVEAALADPLPKRSCYPGDTFHRYYFIHNKALTDAP